MRLVRATGKTEDGTLRPADIAGPAEAIRRDLEELYETAFLAPSLDRPALFSHFSGDARREAEHDLGHLTIGPVRGELDEVVPGARPSASGSSAMPAGTRSRRSPTREFRASAVSGSVHAPVTNHGDYVLRRSNGAWRIVSYDVRGRTPRPEQMQPTGRAGGVRAGAALERPPLRPGDRQRCPARPVGRERARRLDPHRRRQPTSGTRLDPGDPAGLVGGDPRVGDEQDQRRARARRPRAARADRGAGVRDPHRRVRPDRIRRVRAAGRRRRRHRRPDPLPDRRLGGRARTSEPAPST